MIILPSYLEKCPKIIRNLVEVGSMDGFCFGRSTNGETIISWGGNAPGGKNWVLETGFFWDACHVDIGLYKFSALNTVFGKEEIEEFRAPESAMSIVEKAPVKSKYRQVNYPLEWDGVVLALQNPGDRSVLSTGSVEDYYDFVRGACKYYRNHLLLKAHPWNTGEVFERLKSYSDEYGCRIEKTDHTPLKKCRFVLLYNSTFAVDCFLRGAKVAQFAPGYFYQTGAVTYTNHSYPDMVMDTVDYGYKLADFLIWRYCIYSSMPVDLWEEFLLYLDKTTEIFPVIEKYSYGYNYE